MSASLGRKSLAVSHGAKIKAKKQVRLSVVYPFIPDCCQGLIQSTSSFVLALVQHITTLVLSTAWSVWGCSPCVVCKLVIWWLERGHTFLKYYLTMFSDSCTDWDLSFFFQDGFVRVRKRDLEKLTTEVMQLKEFLPRVLNGDLIETLQKARAAQTGTTNTVTIHF